MYTQKNEVRLLIVAAIIAMCCSCAAPASAPSRKPLKVGMMPIVDLAPLFVAQDQGYFANAGLEVEFVKMAGGAVIAPAVEAGELDLGWSNSLSIAIANSQGFDYVFMAPGAFSAPTNDNEVGCILVSSTSDIKSPVDLQGKVVGINTRGNISELIVRVWAKQNGIDPAKLKFSEIPYPNMEAVLTSRGADAALVWEPFASKMLVAKTAKVLDCRPIGKMGGRVLIASWFAKRSWVDKHPAETRSFVEALQRANTYIASNPTAARQVVARFAGVDEALAQSMVLPEFPSNWSKRDLQLVLDLSLQHGMLSKPFDAAKIIANSAGAKD